MNFSGAYIKLLYSICNFFIKKKNEILQCLKSFLCIIFTKLINLSGAYIKLLYSICNFFLFFFFYEILQFLKTKYILQFFMRYYNFYIFVKSNI